MSRGDRRGNPARSPFRIPGGTPAPAARPRSQGEYIGGCWLADAAAAFAASWAFIAAA